MSAIDQAALARNDSFIDRVRILAAKAAIAVSSEAYGGQGQPTAAQHNLRIAYANKYLLDPEKQSIVMVWGVASNPAITSQSIDSDLEFTINSIWDAYSGVAPAVVT